MSATLDRRSFLWCAAAVPAALLPLLLALPGWLALTLAATWLVAVASGRRGRVLHIALRLPLTLLAAGMALAAYGFEFGRDTGAALLATMLVLKLFELRRIRDARSLLGFATFAATAAFLLEQGPALLALALVGLVAVLAALAQVTDREAELDDVPGPRVRLGQALRVALLSLPLAAGGFFLFPRLASPLWGVPGKALEGRTGLSDEMQPGDISQLYIDDSPVLRVDFEGEIPAMRDMYWRGPVLAGFDGRAWTRQLFLERGRFEPIEALGGTLRYRSTQEPSDRRYVLALDMPTQVPEGARASASRSLYSRRRIEEVTSFELESATRYRLAAELPYPRNDRRMYTALPPGFDPRTRELVAGWVAEGDQPAQLVDRALAMFRASFTYTLNPVVLGRNTIDDFLFETRAGYCEHFASAFTVMMRAAGVPARVVTGYQGGFLNPIGGHWVVRQSDAHAWSEVWLAGRGWVRVDPTSAVAPERIQRGTESLAAPSRLANWSRPLRNVADWAMRSWNELVLGFNAERQRSLFSPLGFDELDWRGLGIAFAIGSLLALAITLALVLRERGPRPEPLVLAYQRFVARLRRAGVAKGLAEPPLAFAERAACALPQAARDIRGLSSRYVDWRYAGSHLDTAQRRELAAELRRFRARRRPPPATGVQR